MPRPTRVYTIGSVNLGSEYTDARLVFLLTMNRLKERLKRHPTCHEILAAAKRLGYRKVEEATWTG